MADRSGAGVARYAPTRIWRAADFEWLDSLIKAGKDDEALLRKIEGELPHETLAPRERAVEIDSIFGIYIAAAAGIRCRPDPGLSACSQKPRLQAERPGRREQALETTQEDVQT